MTTRVTSFHVAALAGVSQPTVSRALRNRSEVGADTRTRILDAADQLGYRLDRRAASLRGRATRRIAVIILSTETDERAAPNPFYMTLLAHVVASAARRGHDVLTSFQEDAASFYVWFERNGEADGVILIGSARNQPGWRFFAEAYAKGANVVGWGSSADTLPRVRCDNHAGARMAIEHLLKRGSRRIAFLGPGWRRHQAYRERRHGYMEVIRSAGLRRMECLNGSAGGRETVGFAITNRLLDRAQPPDAIFAACDLLAVGAVRAIHKLSMRVPEDLAVIGFDGISSASHIYPSLTMIEQDVAAAAANLVTTLIEKRVQNNSRISVRLIVRESA